MNSTNTYTAGPWTTSECTPETSEGASYALTTVVENEESHIAFVFNDNPADARLIAAAPDLLEACKGLLLCIGSFAQTGNYPTPNEPEIKAAQTAIKKASDPTLGAGSVL